MGVKISGQYTGGLTMKMTHQLSSTQLFTDPPLDNGGEGKSFSPTDLVATALGACMMSVMTLAARKDGLDLTGMKCEVEKHMAPDLPRRIGALDVQISLPKHLTPEQRTKLQHIGDTCPVLKSLDPKIKIEPKYSYL